MQDDEMACLFFEWRYPGEPARASAPETRVPVLVHHREELIEKHRFRMGWIIL
jgi:hypothetical protein